MSAASLATFSGDIIFIYMKQAHGVWVAWSEDVPGWLMTASTRNQLGTNISQAVRDTATGASCSQVVGDKKHD